MQNSRKRRRVQRRSDAHWKRLGLESESDYFEWCSQHGFKASLNKSIDDQRCELTLSLETGSTWGRISTHSKSTPCPTLAVTEQNKAAVRAAVLKGRVRYGPKCDKHFVGLCRGVERLRGVHFDDLLPIYRELIETCVHRDARFFESPRREVRRLPHATCTYAEALALVAKNKHAWIRPLDEWSIDTDNYVSQFRSLLNHLFVRHSVPNHLFNCWFHADMGAAQFKLPTFLHLAAGHSVRTIHPDWNYSRRMSGCFMNAPQGLSLHHALRWGQVVAWGGSEKLAMAIVKTFLGDMIGSHEFWDSVVQWLIDWQFQVPVAEVLPVCDYLNNQRYGVGNPDKVVLEPSGRRVRTQLPPAQPRMSMNGRTPSALLRDVHRWHSELSKMGGAGNLIWEASSIEPFIYTAQSGKTWVIEELLGDAALYEEGRAMKHCVGCYANQCAEGISTIWSMSHQVPGKLSKRALTLQVVMDTLGIVQARGLANREAKREEIAVMRKWASREYLSLQF